MNAFTLLNAILPLLGALPEVEADITAALKMHWGKDHVQQAVQGVAVLSKIVNDVTSTMQPQELPAPITGSAV